MGLTLVSDPVTTDISGNTVNIFPGFLPVLFEFKREDLPAISVSSGVDSKILITVATDLTTILSPGDSIYLFSPGTVSNFEYDLSAEIITITATEITIDSPFIESGGAGYINYLKNYYVEAQLVDVNNANLNLLDFNLRDNGSPDGVIKIDVSIGNDKNREVFTNISDELTEGRIKFDFQYREVFEGSSNSYTAFGTSVILVYASDNFSVEDFPTSFDVPKIYKGYDSGITFLHTDENAPFEALNISYQQLDINKSVLVGSQIIKTFQSETEYGALFSKWDKNFNLNINTQYIKFEFQFGDLPFFDPNFFDGAFFETT